MVEIQAISEEKTFIAIAAGLLLVVAFFSMQFFSTKPIEGFTAAYFDINSIPQQAFSGKSFPIKFFIENHEGKSTEYSINVVSEGKIANSEKIVLENGEKKAFEKSLSLSKSGSIEKVSVQVLKKNESKPIEISFWVKVEKQ